MLIDSKPAIVSVSYSEITKKLTVKYNDNSIEEFINVPRNVYENIVNNGKVLSDYLKENLNTNYKKIELV